MSDPNVPQPAAAPLSDSETRQWAGFAHLGGILGFLPSLIIWLVYKERSAFVADESRKALNFQITVTIASIVLNIAGFMIPGLGLLVFAVWVVSLIFSILGFQAVQKGQGYRYPFSLELIK